MNKYTWTLTPSLEDIELENIHQYSCYDDKCLISTFYLDEIIDFLDENKIKYSYYELTEKYQYKIVINLSEEDFENKKDKIIQFQTGRFKTSSIYIFNEAEDKWIKLYRIKSY